MAAIVAAVVASHWLLDLVVHVPDLPLARDDGVKLGFGLWSTPLVALSLELVLVLVVAGVALYAQRGGARRARVVGLGAVLVVLTIAGFYGPIPPSIEALYAMQLALYIGVAAHGAWVARA